MRVFNQWLREWQNDVFSPILKVFKPLEEMTNNEINHVLKYFIPAVRKANGMKYPTRTIKEIVSMIQHYIVNVLNLKLSIFVDDEFAEAMKILDLCMKESAKDGNVHPPKRAEVITKEQEDHMWTQNILGDGNPQQLLDTVIFYLGLHLCLRASSEHRDLVFGANSQLQLKVEKGVEIVEYVERVSKNKRFGLKQSRAEPKVVRIFPSSNKSRCVVRLYKLYISHR
jgi:hypothetical protein